MDARALIDELNRTDEHARLEAKAARELGPSTLESICALANEPGLGGGVVVLGVEQDDQGKYVAAGVPDPDKATRDLASSCATTFNRPVRPRIHTDMVDGKAVLVAEVDELPAGDKPLFFTKQGLPRGAFRRVGSTDQRLTDDDLAGFFEDRRGRQFDRSPLVGARMEDLDAAAIAEYRRLRARLQPRGGELGWSDSELLEALGAVERHGEELVPTLAGIVVFGHARALRRLFPMLRVDYVRVYGTEWAPGPDGRFDTREFRGPAILLLKEIVGAVLDGMLKRIVIGEDQLQRREIPQLPAEVIREAIVNALMHRSYRRQDPLMIIRYTNRLEILNPGVSLKHEEAFGTPGSVPRNPAIATIFHETGLAETKGSGIRAMRERMAEAGLSAPTLVSDRRDDRFTARLLFHHFLDRADLAWLERFAGLGLTAEESAALVFVREVMAIDHLTFRQVTGADAATATASLRRLRQVGLLDLVGKGARAHYVPTARFLEEFAEGQSPVPQAQSPETGVIPEQSPQSRVIPGTHYDTDTPADLRAALPAELARALETIGARPSRAAFKQLLVRLCAWRPLRAEQLAWLTSRRRDYLVKHYLSDMVAANELAFTIPQMPQHPLQAYRPARPSQQEIPDA